MDSCDWIEQTVEAWRINHRINLYLIERISDAGMKCTLSTRGGRNVVRQFAHLQYARAYQLQKRARALAEGIRIFATAEEPDRKTLTAVLEDSAGRIEQWIRLAASGAPGVRTFRRGLIPTVAYLVAHESHHRGSILLTLKQCGQGLKPEVRGAIWDWDHR